MGIKIMSLVWDNDNLDITNTEQSVLLKLADYADEYGANIYPSYATLARKLRLDRRTIMFVIKRLEEKKLLKKIVRGSRYQTNEYEINLRNLAKGYRCEYAPPEPLEPEASSGGGDLGSPGSDPGSLDESTVVIQDHQGGDPGSPDQSVDPSVVLNNSNSNSRSTIDDESRQTATATGFKILTVDDVKELLSYDVKESQLKTWVEKYGEKAINDLIAPSRAKENPGGWINAMLKRGLVSKTKPQPRSEEISHQPRREYTKAEKVELAKRMSDLEWRRLVDKAVYINQMVGLEIAKQGVELNDYNKIRSNIYLLERVVDFM